MDVTLALGGGGVRGIAHIGVLRVLERNGFRIRAIAGTSIGSIIGALYSSGKTPDQIEEILTKIDQLRLYGWPLSDGPGLLGLRGISEFLKTHLGELIFDDLKIPFAAVAVDLNSNREIILREGVVVDAILGSIAVPGLFPPKEIDQYLLIDGGVLDPVPVRAARELAPGLPVVAVSLMAPLEAPSTPLNIPSNVPRQLLDQITRLNVTKAFRVFADAIVIAQRQMTVLRLQIDSPEVLVRPEVNDLNLLDRINIQEVASRGDRAMEIVLPDLYRAVALPARAARRLRRIMKGG
jgi:NTE family protein